MTAYSPDIMIDHANAYRMVHQNGRGQERVTFAPGANGLYIDVAPVSRLLLLTRENDAVTPWDKLAEIRNWRLKGGLSALDLNEDDPEVRALFTEALERGLFPNVAVAFTHRNRSSRVVENDFDLWRQVEPIELRGYQQIVNPKIRLDAPIKWTKG
jgi:hypothetical protein